MTIFVLVLQETRVKVDVERPSREGGGVTATATAWSTNSAAQITWCTVMQQVSSDWVCVVNSNPHPFSSQPHIPSPHLRLRWNQASLISSFCVFLMTFQGSYKNRAAVKVFFFWHRHLQHAHNKHAWLEKCINVLKKRPGLMRHVHLHVHHHLQQHVLPHSQNIFDFIINFLFLFHRPRQCSSRGD